VNCLRSIRIAGAVIEPKQRQRKAGWPRNAVRRAVQPSDANAIQEEPTAVPKKNTSQTKKPSAHATVSGPMTEAERRIAEARRQNATDLNLSGL
jgi:D-aminopeptidase